MPAFCASGAHVLKVRSAPVLEIRYFRLQPDPNPGATFCSGVHYIGFSAGGNAPGKKSCTGRIS